jgi:hypothetical protein
MTDRRELYRSPSGDSWFLGREPTDGRAFILHQPNAPSGGRLSHIELGEFLRRGNGPEQQALLRLIASLVEPLCPGWGRSADLIEGASLIPSPTMPNPSVGLKSSHDGGLVLRQYAGHGPPRYRARAEPTAPPARCRLSRGPACRLARAGDGAVRVRFGSYRRARLSAAFGTCQPDHAELGRAR